jgi:expansin (peptidoglycan-binding protein)
MLSLKALLTITTIAFHVAAAPAPAGDNTESYSGDMTYYDPEGAVGKCAHNNLQTDYVVALSPSQLNGVANCDKMIRIHRNGLSTAAKVVDLCPECGSGSIDVTPAVFDVLADPVQGRVHVNWEFI